MTRPDADDIPDAGEGPWDVGDMADVDVSAWVDLGALLVPPNAGVDLQAQADPATGVISELSLATPEAAVRVQPFAGPRSPGMWDDVRGQLIDSLRTSGITVTEVDGPFGRELLGDLPNAQGAREPARFAGVDGPRWFLRMIFLGKAARTGPIADRLQTAVRSLVVVRGSEAMPVGAPLPLKLPASVAEAPQAPVVDRPRVTLPSRGPEITEVR